MTRMPVNGVSLNAETRGQGPPLLLLHGFTGSVETWAPFVDAFGQVRTVITVDLLGHGASDAPADSARYRVERTVEDLTAVLDRLGVGQFDLLGYSMGGRVALRLALTLGRRVDRLILESTSPGIGNADERSSRRRQDEALAGTLEQEGIERFVEYWERLPIWESQSDLPARTRDELRRQRLAENARGLARSLRGLSAGVMEPVWHRLPELGSTLLLAGELDHKYVSLARRMAEWIPQAQEVLMPGAGHAIHLERPAAFREAVRTYLDGDSLSVPQPTAHHGATP